MVQILTAETVSDDRNDEYEQGGVLFVTSRILVVDLLTKTVPVHLIDGIVVGNAHRVRCGLSVVQIASRLKRPP